MQDKRNTNSTRKFEGKMPKSDIKFYPEIAKLYKMMHTTPSREIMEKYPFVEELTFEKVNPVFERERRNMTYHALEVLDKTWNSEKGKKFVEHLILSFHINHLGTNPNKAGEIKKCALTKTIIYDGVEELTPLVGQMLKYIVEHGLERSMNPEWESDESKLKDIEKKMEWDVRKYFHVINSFPIAIYSTQSDVILSKWSFIALNIFYASLDEQTQLDIARKMRARQRYKEAKKESGVRDGKFKFGTSKLPEGELEKLKRMKDEMNDSGYKVGFTDHTEIDASTASDIFKNL